jgi:hypothetical protein
MRRHERGFAKINLIDFNPDPFRVLGGYAGWQGNGWVCFWAGSIPPKLT